MMRSEDVRDWLHDALRHLYDLTALQDSPLISALELGAADDPALALRQTLTVAIRALEPGAEVRADAPAWRSYEILLYRYVQQWSQQQVADQMALSIRHLRREENRAVDELARALEGRLQRPGEGPEDGPVAVNEPHLKPGPADELAWLEAASPTEPVSVAAALAAAIGLARSLAAQHQVELQMQAHQTPALAIHPLALRQALLSLITTAIHCHPGGAVVAEISEMAGHVLVQISASGEPRWPEGDAADAECLQMVLRLVAPWGGQLTLDTGRASFAATLEFPAPRPIPVLLIDDNRDTWQLFQRYVAGTRYRLLVTDAFEKALALVAEHLPQVIVLDVMMPDVDGWEMLGRLRQHPLTGTLPLVVCTILTHDELARSLGADAFLRKPVTREMFLQTLAVALDQVGPGSC